VLSTQKTEEDLAELTDPVHDGGNNDIRDDEDE